MSHAPQPETAGTSTTGLLLPFSAAVGTVIGAIVLLAVTQTVVALIAALLTLVVLLAGVAVLVSRVMADDGDDAEPVSAPSPATDTTPVPLTRRRHHLPMHRAA